MQSFTTQSHHRNYQGNVVIENPNQTHSQPKRHKNLTVLALSMLALAVAVTGSMLGITTLHNQQLKHQVQSLQMQTTQTTNSKQNEVNQSELDVKQHLTQRNNLQCIPISNKQHDAQPLPCVNIPQNTNR